MAPTLVVLAAGVAGAEEFPKALVTWRRDPAGPVFAGTGGPTWDRKIRERGWVLFADGAYHLWYTGYNDERSPTRFLGHATSTDGLRWARDRENPQFTGSWVEDVCVVRREGTYYLFAEGKDDVAHLLTSADGRHWVDCGRLDIRTTDGRPLTPGPYGTPTAWVEDGTWYLFYERGDQGVWLATSRDRRVWTNVQDDPVLARGPEPYDREAIALNQVVKRDGIYYGVYHANAHRPWRDWTTCLARSNDLVHWEKYPGNPIVVDNASSGLLVETPEGLRLYTMHPEVRRYSNGPTSPTSK